MAPTAAAGNAAWLAIRNAIFSGCVGLLSNLFGLAGDRASTGAMLVRQALPAELEAAVRLVLSPPEGPVDARDAREFIDFARERDMELAGAHVALRDGKLVSAMLPIISPGRTMLILCSSGALIKGGDEGLARLIDPVCGFGADKGVQLAQVLIDPRDTALEKSFLDHRFDVMAELHYLQLNVHADAAPPAQGPPLRWINYDDRTHDLFARVILETYRDSLDCPALNGRRRIEDIIAGHKASGIFDPSLWWVLADEQEALGVLLLSQSLRSDAMELVYLGLTPEARGRKLGELLLRHALAVIAARKHPRLCLAVDSKNAPALKLYYRHGMRRVAGKRALLRELRARGEES